MLWTPLFILDRPQIVGWILKDMKDLPVQSFTKVVMDVIESIHYKMVIETSKQDGSLQYGWLSFDGLNVT